VEIYEILDKVATAASREDKMKVLVDNDCLALRDIMKINFDNDLKIHVSKKIDWMPSDDITNSLKGVTKYLVPLSKGDIEIERADKSFKAMLEQINPMDAQILYDAVKGNLKVKGLTEKLVKGVWGDKFIT